MLTTINFIRLTASRCHINNQFISSSFIKAKSRLFPMATNAPPPYQEFTTTLSEPVLTAERRQEIESQFFVPEHQLPTLVERHHPILPRKDARNILITSALPYVNNIPHLGNIIGCVLSADVYSRYCRLRNYNVLYVCGTDEYGTATETKALEENTTPEELCDRYFALHADIYKWFDIDFDKFGRTTSPAHKKIAQDMFLRLYENNYLIEKDTEQLYCVACSRFLADRYVEGTCPTCAYDEARGDQCDKCGNLMDAVKLINPRCKVCSKHKSAPGAGSTIELRTSRHLYLDLTKLQPDVQKWKDSAFGKPHAFSANADAITQGWLDRGLLERCLTRDLRWGTPVPSGIPGFESKVFYVWFDAPIGYISITASYTDEWKKWWFPRASANPLAKTSNSNSDACDIELIQFLGKDNVPFHCIIFPASLIGTHEPWTIVSGMSVTEYLRFEGEKFSKSRGTGVFGDQARATGIPADMWRFYLLYVRPEGQDADFQWSDFARKHNNELLNNVGNFFNRAPTFLKKFFDGKIGPIRLEKADSSGEFSDPSCDDYQLVSDINIALENYLQCMERRQLRDAIRYIMQISTRGNQSMQANKPWVQVKDEKTRARAWSTVSLACNIGALLSVMIEPYMPKTSQTMQMQLNLPRARFVLPTKFQQLLAEGHVIGEPSPIFEKIDEAREKQLSEQFSGAGKAAAAATAAAGGASGTLAAEPPPAAAAAATPQEIEQAKADVEQQAARVRSLKAAPTDGAEKTPKAVLDAEIKRLQELKAVVEKMQGMGVSTTTTAVDNKGGGAKSKKQSAANSSSGKKQQQSKQNAVDDKVVVNEKKQVAVAGGDA